ncbi:MAG: hypothetical protein HYR63_09890 [Proteobacteria bacterium]|nr:hypothetical protein [Pseudomonadota bacterium]MBI3499215.1 hypothetical protein [Pseudomonadota bacterium]
MRKALIFTPERAHDPYLDDGPPPLLALQLYFDEIADLEATLVPSGSLQHLTSARDLPSLLDAEASQQAMLTRILPVPDPEFRTPPAASPCTYLVAYDGPADDLNAWLGYYIRHHPPIMARFPGIRQIEIYTRIDWCSALPWRRADCMQRNKVVFDDAAALTAALNSPVRHEMRADFHNLPPFSGPVSHYPMSTMTLGGNQPR